jgi:hypothetical protein
VTRAGVITSAVETPDDDHFSIHLATADPASPWTSRVREWMINGASRL